MVMKKRIDESVRLLKAEAVEKVEGWEGNESVLVMTATLNLREGVVMAAAAVERLEAAVAVVVVVAERLAVVAVVVDVKVVMAQLEALKEGGVALTGKVVVEILDAKEMSGEVVSSGAAVAVGRLRGAVEAVEDSRTGVVGVVGCRMEEVGEGVLWMVVVEAGVLRMVGEVVARDWSGKTRQLWGRVV